MRLEFARAAEKTLDKIPPDRRRQIMVQIRILAADRGNRDAPQDRYGRRQRFVHVIRMPDVGTAFDDAVRFHLQNERKAGRGRMIHRD